MSKRCGNDGGNAQDKLQREINWDAVAAIIAVIIGLIAILVSAYTAWNERQQIRAVVWSYLQVGESDYLPSDLPVKKNTVESHGGLLVAMIRAWGRPS